MNPPEDEVQRKLKKIEKEISDSPLPVNPMPATTVTQDKQQLSADLQMIIGFALLLTGVFLVFHHVQVGTSILAMFGFGHQGFGLTIIPLLIGLGIVFYNAQSRLGWIIVSASCALIFFAVLSQLIMTFPTISLLGLVIMFLPLAVGAALVLKGVSSRKAQ